MNRIFHIAPFFALAVTALQAGPAESAIIAALKLPDAPNYSWVTTVVDDARTYTIDGKTEREGDFSLVTLPAVAALRRRLGLNGGHSDNAMTAIYQGSQPLLVQVGDTWKAIDELPDNANAGLPKGGWGGPRAGVWDGATPGVIPPFSNLQLTLSRPHEEIAIIVVGSSDLHVELDGVSGALSEIGAKLLLVHPGQNELTPLIAEGTFRLWISRGVLVKYQTTLAGTLAVSSARNRREVRVHQRSITVLNDVGTTKFVVPVEAKAWRP